MPPELGTTSPSIMAMVVVLPAPLAPSRAKLAPRSTVKLRSSTATAAP